MVQYHLPRRRVLAVVLAAVCGRRRSFLRDARGLARGLSSLRVLGQPPDLASGRWLVTVNHYSRPGFNAWWIPITIVATLGCEVRWIITSTLTFQSFLLSHTYTPLSAWFLPRLAHAFDFFLMPPMPPRPQEVAARARDVRQVLRYARLAPNPLIGLAPEGGDSAEHRLTLPPPGAGRFIARLAGAGLTLLPIGAYEDGDSFCLRFGPPYNLPANLPADPAARDACVARLTFRAIADLLPAELVPPGLLEPPRREDTK